MTKKVETLFIVLWIFLTIPLIFLSYGSDPDTGLLAKAANKIWENGEYFKSRTTGFPLYEIFLSPLVVYGQWYLSNLLSVFSGLLHLLGLLYLARRKEFNNPLLVVLCVAFSPLIIKNSTSTMDYMAALALLTWSYVFMRQGKYFIAAVLVGVAAGFRPTSGLFIIPILVYAWANKMVLSKLVKIYFLAFFVGTICYLPVLLKYGLPQNPVIDSGLLSKALLIGYNYLNFFGIITSLIVYPSLLYIFFSQRRTISPLVMFHFTNIIIWTGMFIYIPYESEFLLPMILSITLLLDKYIDTKLFLIITISLLSYHIFKFDLLSGSSGERVIAPSFKEGYTVSDIRHRIFQRSLREISTTFKVTQATILTFGASFIPITNEGWVYDSEHDLYKQRKGQLYVQKGENVCQRLQELSGEGYKIIVWNDMKSFLMNCNGWQEKTEMIYDLNSFFGTSVEGKALTSD